MILTTTYNSTKEQEGTGISPCAESLPYESILRVLVYYDLFLYPLTSREVYRFVNEADVLPEEIGQGLAALRAQGKLDCSKGFWFLAERGQEVVERRLQMEERGRKMWKTARRIGSLMKMAPFVRGIYISGQLSRYIADEKSDIDYFVVTEPGRLWIVRTLFVLCRRTLFLNSRKYFCTNYFVTTDNLVIRERNVYTACEVTALKPLWNAEVFRRFVAGNGWVSRFYPNFSYGDVEFRPGVRERRSRVQSLLERMIPKGFAARLDSRLMRSTRDYLRRKFPHCPQALHNTALRCAPNESRAHPQDQSVYVLSRYRTALALRGISHAEAPQEKPCRKG